MATIELLSKSKTLLESTVQEATWSFSSRGDAAATVENLSVDVHTTRSQVLKPPGSRRTEFRTTCLRIVVQGWPLSEGGSGVHYPRVAVDRGWIMGPLSKGGHRSRAGHYPRAGRAADTREALSTFCKGAHRGGGHDGGFENR